MLFRANKFTNVYLIYIHFSYFNASMKKIVFVQNAPEQKVREPQKLSKRSKFPIIQNYFLQNCGKKQALLKSRNK